MNVIRDRVMRLGTVRMSIAKDPMPLHTMPALAEVGLPTGWPGGQGQARTRQGVATSREGLGTLPGFPSICRTLSGSLIRSGTLLTNMLSTTAALVVAIAMVLANAFFVASEFAIVKIRPTRVRELVKQGSRRAMLLSGILRRLDAYLSANQLGITLASLALGWVGEPAFAHALEPHLAPLGAWAGIASHSLALGFSFGVITFLHAVVGELVPKALAL